MIEWLRYLWGCLRWGGAANYKLHAQKQLLKARARLQLARLLKESISTGGDIVRRVRETGEPVLLLVVQGRKGDPAPLKETHLAARIEQGWSYFTGDEELMIFVKLEGGA